MNLKRLCWILRRLCFFHFHVNQVQTEPRHGGERDRCRLRTPGTSTTRLILGVISTMVEKEWGERNFGFDSSKSRLNRDLEEKGIARDCGPGWSLIKLNVHAMGPLTACYAAIILYLPIMATISLDLEEPAKSKLDFERTQPKKSHPSLRPPSNATSSKHLTSLLALAIGLPTLVEDSGHEQ